MSLRHSRWENSPTAQPVQGAQSVTHIEMLDHPANVGSHHRRLFALCGQYYAVYDFAAHVDLVTCPRCAARLAELEALEL